MLNPFWFTTLFVLCFYKDVGSFIGLSVQFFSKSVFGSNVELILT